MKVNSKEFHAQDNFQVDKQAKKIKSQKEWKLMGKSPVNVPQIPLPSIKVTFGLFSQQMGFL